MDLIVFDIDGTLTNTTNIDDLCFKTAFCEVLNINIDQQDWSMIKHVTDRGITHELYHQEYGVDIPADTLQEFRSGFVKLLAAAYDKDSTLYQEIPGATQFLSLLKDSDQYAIALATGAWSDSASIKLEAIGLDCSHAPFSHSDNFISREEIVLDAIQKSKQLYQTKFNKTIYFGDGVWDFKTCAKLNIPFIGVDHSNNGKLIELGAQHVICDYSNIHGVMQIVEGLK